MSTEKAQLEARDERNTLNSEWHARPNVSLPAPFRCTHVVNFRDGQTQDECRQALAQFCRAHGQPPPSEDSRHHLLEVGPSLIKWESHTEVTAHTILVAGNGSPLFSESALDFLPEDKHRELREGMFLGVKVEVMNETPEDDPEGLQLARSLLGSNAIYGGWMANSSAIVWSSFRVDSQGFVRLLIIDRDLSQERLSRLLQRMLEMESYRLLAMKALPVARTVMGALELLEPQLDAVMRRLADDADEAAQEQALREITAIAARVEQIASEHAYRFAGARAYLRIVERRAEEVKETQLGSFQRYTNFLLKSLLPAMRTCDAAERRTQELAERVSRAANLLSTMVSMEQARQSQDIMASMAERAGVQLRLQQAVEGFSIFAISYYAVGLVSYTLKAAEGSGYPLNSELWTGIAAPGIFAAVFIAVRWVRHRLMARLEERAGGDARSG